MAVGLDLGPIADHCQACGRRDAERRACGHALCADCYLFAPFRVVDGQEIQCPICLPRP